MPRRLMAPLAVRLGALLVLSAGCTERTQFITAPPPQSPSVPDPAPIAPAPPFPALTHSGQIYRASDSLYDLYATYHQSHLASRFVLYEDGKFDLQFSSARFGFFEYHGFYADVGSGFDFTFDAESRWSASGTLRGDQLTVTYNLIASLSDFVDGDYVLTPGQ